jgi:hypothetical protein
MTKISSSSNSGAIFLIMGLGCLLFPLVVYLTADDESGLAVVIYGIFLWPAGLIFFVTGILKLSVSLVHDNDEDYIKPPPNTLFDATKPVDAWAGLHNQSPGTAPVNDVKEDK